MYSPRRWTDSPATRSRALRVNVRLGTNPPGYGPGSSPRSRYSYVRRLISCSRAGFTTRKQVVTVELERARCCTRFKNSSPPV
jgi:hypothetical protein